jgi:hypothetical protein
VSKTLTNLRSLTRYYALGDSTATNYSDADTLINLNGRYQDAFLLATQHDGDFQFNGDGSQSISITSGVRAYTLATDLFKADRVEIKYPSTATTYQQAIQIDENQIRYYGRDNYIPSPPEFGLQGTKIEIFVSAKTADITAVTDGIKVYYQKELTELVNGSDAVIFPDVFARYIAIGAAMDYCGVNGLNARLSWLETEYQKQETKLLIYVANRNQAKRLTMSFRQEPNELGSGFAPSDKQVPLN